MRPPDWAIRTKADTLAIEQGAVWVQAEADKVCRFAEAFIRPQFINGTFRLLEWQRRFLSALYAWRWKDGRRRFRFANLHIAKKSGNVSLALPHELDTDDRPQSVLHGHSKK